jgi:hypothetical protein
MPFNAQFNAAGSAALMDSTAVLDAARPLELNGLLRTGDSLV